jgi:hypothetical protein
MYDYLSTVTPDYATTTFQVAPQEVLAEEGEKLQVVHFADDGSEERIDLSTASIFYVTLVWKSISASDAGTIVDFYHDSAKGNGITRSFKWTHPTDGHTYVVRFNDKLGRTIRPVATHGINAIRLRVLGRIADA